MEILTRILSLLFALSLAVKKWSAFCATPLPTLTTWRPSFVEVDEEEEEEEATVETVVEDEEEFDAPVPPEPSGRSSRGRTVRYSAVMRAAGLELGLAARFFNMDVAVVEDAGSESE
jgi:hypothetical protein